MRKLTDAEVQELRDCKGTRNGQALFFEKAKRMYANDPETLVRLNELNALRQSVDDILAANPFAFGASEKTRHAYYEKMDAFLSDIGYTPAPGQELTLAEKLELFFQ